MQLFFTGAQFFNAAQASGEHSLGGYVSGSQVPNGKINSLFPEISKYTEERGEFEIRGIALINTTGADIVGDVFIWHDYLEATGNRTKIEISPVSLAMNQKMEAISDGNSLPYVGQFYDTEGTAKKILIASGIAKNAGVGLWIRRIMISPDPIDSLECSELKAYMATQKKKEIANVSISY